MKSLEEIYKNPRFQAMAIIVVIIIVGWLVLKNPSQKAVAPTINNNQEISAPQNSTQDVANSWEGALKLSNNPQKGNLMLKTQEYTIYIKTNRDFSSLVDKEVVVTYEGDLESFRLGDIKAK